MWYESHESKERTTEICARMFDSAFQIRLFSLMLPYATNAPIRSLRNHFTPLYSWEFCHLMKKKKQPCTCSTLFCTFLCRCLPRLQRETPKLHVLSRKCRTCSRSLFFTTALFHLALVAASISHFVTSATKFPCCSSRKKTSSLFFYLSLYSSDPLFLVELRCPAAYFLFFSVFLLFYIPNLWTWQLI